LIPTLDPRAREAAALVQAAATTVRTAKTKKEAVTAITNAIAEVHKSIALLKADDSTSLRSNTRDGNFAVETLHIADDKLQKAVGL
jgi:hypothetical protein